MPFAQRHDAIIQKRGPSPEYRLWRNTIVLSLATFGVALLYLWTEMAAITVQTINRAFAVNATVLIGLSLMLSALCYFWDFVDTKIIYRKYLGLVGFGYALLHAYTSSVFYYIRPVPGASYDFFVEWPFFGLSIANLTAFLFGLFALLIFIFMAAISNRYAVTELGGKRWRMLLRFGYLGYVSVVVHYGLKNSFVWERWFLGKEGVFPPISLVLFLFALVVFGLRLALSVSVRRKKAANQTASTAQPSDPANPSSGGED